MSSDGGDYLDRGDNAWQMTAATLVGLQSIPGLMILYGGVVKKKWAVNSAFMIGGTGRRFCVEGSSLARRLADGRGAGAPAAMARFWCHQCKAHMQPEAAGAAGAEELVCPRCHGGFIEEIEDDPRLAILPAEMWPADGSGGEGGGTGVDMSFLDLLQRGGRGGGGGGGDGQQAQVANAFRDSLSAMAAISQVLQNGPHGRGAAGTGMPQGGTMGFRIHIGGGGGHRGQAPGGGEAVQLDSALLQGLFGGNVEIFVDHGLGGGPQHVGFPHGDYFQGPNWEQFLQQLAEQDQNRHGPPPAAKTAVEAMPVIIIGAEHVGTDASQCAVCKDEFEHGTAVRQMPCK
eukprot:SM000098S25132  [mRNA]  locus=s98:384788:386607:- [translate_table: standard]